MKFWTVQSREVVNIAKETGIYQPDFSKGIYLEGNEGLSQLYAGVLDSFNHINGTKLPGLIFGWAGGNANEILCIEDFDTFKDFMKNKKSVISSLWRTLKERDTVIVELDYKEPFNPILVDINDFQFLMPPVMLLPPYTADSINRICYAMANGVIMTSEFPSYLIQAHLPNIKAENIVNTYEMFDL